MEISEATLTLPILRLNIAFSYFVRACLGLCKGVGARILESLVKKEAVFRIGQVSRRCFPTYWCVASVANFQGLWSRYLRSVAPGSRPYPRLYLNGSAPRIHPARLPVFWVMLKGSPRPHRKNNSQNKLWS